MRPYSRHHEPKAPPILTHVLEDFGYDVIIDDAVGPRGEHILERTAHYHRSYDCGCVACDLNEVAPWANPMEWEYWVMYQLELYADGVPFSNDDAS